MIELLYGTSDDTEDAWCGGAVDGQLLELAARVQELIKLPDNIPPEVLKEHERWLNLPHNHRLNRIWIYRNIEEWEAVKKEKWADYFWRYL